MRNKKVIQHLIGLLVCLLFNFSLYSQGVWNIRYTPLESINRDFIGKNIRIDFKASENDTLVNKSRLFIRGLLSNEDVIELEINNRIVTFKENWNVYPDHGVLNEQNLRSSNVDTNKTIIIEKLILKGIHDKYLILKADVTEASNCNGKNINDLNEFEISVKKSEIKGILSKYDNHSP